MKKSGRSRITVNEILIYLSVSALGVFSIVIPVFILPLNHHDSPLFPIVATGIEGISSLSFALLFLTGIIAKLYSRLPGWKIGLLTMALFPVVAICEIIVDSSSHNMLPFEFVFYAFYTVPAMVGAYICQGVLKLFQKPK